MPLKIVRNNSFKKKCNTYESINYAKALEDIDNNGLKEVAIRFENDFNHEKDSKITDIIEELKEVLENKKLLIYLIVPEPSKKYEDLDSYISSHYIKPARSFEKMRLFAGSVTGSSKKFMARTMDVSEGSMARPMEKEKCEEIDYHEDMDYEEEVDFHEQLSEKLQQRLSHQMDTFSEYLLYLIESKGMTNAQVYKRALVDKKTFSKIKNNKNAHPQKITAMCLCVGAMLNLDESRDLLERAGYALSPCEVTDVIFSYFIENKIYDMIELDIQLEEHGEKSIIV